MALVLTQRGVDVVKPATKRFNRPDGIVPGLRLRVFPSGEKTYSLATRIAGKLTTITIGSAAVLTLAEARHEGKRLLAEIAQGGDPRETERKAAKVASETVEITVRQFIERHAKIRNRSWRETEQRFERDVLPRWRNRPVTSIVRSDVIALLDAIVDRKAPIAANRTLASLRSMFNWAVERGVLETSPCDRVKPPAPERPCDRMHTDAELALIWRAAAMLTGPPGAFVKLLILLAQRRCETAGILWSELDPALTTWSLPAARTKNDTAHQVPLAPVVRDIIEGLPRTPGSDFVLSTDGKVALNAFSRIKRQLDDAVTALNGGVPLPPWTFHDFRRTAASGMARLGVQLPAVEKILNHTGASFGGVAGIYQRHDFADEKREALARWAAHVLGLAANGDVIALRA